MSGTGRRGLPQGMTCARADDEFYTCKVVEQVRGRAVARLRKPAEWCPEHEICGARTGRQRRWPSRAAFVVAREHVAAFHSPSTAA